MLKTCAIHRIWSILSRKKSGRKNRGEIWFWKFRFGKCFDQNNSEQILGKVNEKSKTSKFQKISKFRFLWTFPKIFPRTCFDQKNRIFFEPKFSKSNFSAIFSPRFFSRQNWSNPMYCTCFQHPALETTGYGKDTVKKSMDFGGFRS